MNTSRNLIRHGTLLCVLMSCVALGQLSGQEAKKTATAATSDSDSSTDQPKSGSDTDRTVKMNPFVVNQDSSLGYTASDTISGSKVAMKIIEVPQTLSVITRAAMDDSGLMDPNQLFEKYAAGVSNLTGPGIEGTNAIIRGFRAQNWSVNGATTHYLSELVSDNFETIEVIKGPSVMLYGRSAGYGGYINITTQRVAD